METIILNNKIVGNGRVKRGDNIPDENRRKMVSAIKAAAAAAINTISFGV